jgi:hypothetical protein
MWLSKVSVVDGDGSAHKIEHSIYVSEYMWLQKHPTGFPANDFRK